MSWIFFCNEAGESFSRFAFNKALLPSTSSEQLHCLLTTAPGSFFDFGIRPPLQDTKGLLKP